MEGVIQICMGPCGMRIWLSVWASCCCKDLLPLKHPTQACSMHMWCYSGSRWHGPDRAGLRSLVPTADYFSPLWLHFISVCMCGMLQWQRFLHKLTS